MHTIDKLHHLTRAAALAMLALASLAAAQPTWDFETGNRTGWTISGTAFLYQPTFGNNVASRNPGLDIGIQGNYWVGTYERRPSPAATFGGTQGDGPVGVMYSDPITLNRRYISFLIGGGNNYARLRVELLVKLNPGEDPPAGLEFIGLGGRHPFPDGDYFIGNAATGQNSEVMRRVTWDAALHSGRSVRMRIIDNSSYSWGHINADDFRFNDQPSSTILTVRDEAGAVVPGAEVYVNDAWVGNTGDDGRYTIEPAPVRGTRVIVRKRVHERQAYRARHMLGSTQNWSYRAYVSNLRVNANGSTSPTILDGDTRNVTINLSRSNALFGMHWVVSAEYDLSADAMYTLRENIRAASQTLYNLTDGQVFVEQVEFKDNLGDWDFCDFKVYGNRSLRANAYKAGFLYNLIFLGHTAVNINPLNAPYVWSHEFGHSGFDLDDEYDDNNGNTLCTPLVRGQDPSFGITRDAMGNWLSVNPLAACAMWNNMPKLCAANALNPHTNGTRQGAEACWTTFMNRYRDTQVPARWLMQSPDTRGYVGTLVPLPFSWEPRFTTQNTSHANLVPEFTLWLTTEAGAPIADREVWLETTYGQRILMGKTQNDNTTTTEDETGKIILHAAHIGDRITAGGGANYTVPIGPTIASMLDGQPEPDFMRGPAEQGQKTFLVLPNQPEARFEAIPQGNGKMTLRVYCPPDFGTLPTAEYSLGGKWISVALNAVGGDFFEGLITGLPTAFKASVRVAVSSQQGEFDWMGQVLGSGSNTKQKYHLPSMDGGLALRMTPGSMASNGPLTVGPAIPTPPLAGGDLILAGPYRVGGTVPLQRQVPGNFLLEEGKKGDKVPPPYNFNVMYFDESKNAWVELPHNWIPNVDIVSFKMPQFGVVALVARA